MSDDNDDNERKDDAPKSGQVIRAGAPLPVAAPTGLRRTLYRLFARLSIFPSFNRRYVKSLKTATEVFEAKNELGKAIGEHQEVRDRLQNFGDIIALRREERKRHLFEEQERRRAAENTFKHEKKMQAIRNRQKEEEVEVARKKLEKEKAQLQKDIDDLKPPPPPEPPPKKTTARGRSPKQKRREEVITKYEREIARIEASKKTEKAKATLKKAAEAEKEEELQKIDNVP